MHCIISKLLIRLHYNRLVRIAGARALTAETLARALNNAALHQGKK